MYKIKLVYIFLAFNPGYLLCFNDNQNLDSKIEYVKPEKTLFQRLKFWNKDQLNVKYKFDKFTAIIPEEFYFIIDGFKNRSILLNRLILHGPPGNGKSTLANEVSKELDAEFIEINGPSVVTKFQGSGAETIKKSFERALEYLKYKKKVVVFIDEIDAINPNFDQDDRFHDHKSALQTLWLWLDKIKNMPNIFIIAATNKFEKLDKAFITRFDGNIIELQNPQELARQEVIEFYIKEFNKQISKPVDLDNYLIQYLVDKTDGLNTRTIEGIVRLVVQRASSNNGITTSFIANIISKQKKIVLAENKDDKNNKRDLASKIKSNLTVINVSLSVFCSCLFLYERFIKHQNTNALWNPILKFAERLGLKEFVEIAKNSPEEVAKASNALNLKTAAIMGSVALSKSGNVVDKILDQLPINLKKIF